MTPHRPPDRDPVNHRCPTCHAAHAPPPPHAGTCSNSTTSTPPAPPSPPWPAPNVNTAKPSGSGGHDRTRPDAVPSRPAAAVARRPRRPGRRRAPDRGRTVRLPPRTLHAHAPSEDHLDDLDDLDDLGTHGCHSDLDGCDDRVLDHDRRRRPRRTRARRRTRAQRRARPRPGSRWTDSPTARTRSPHACYRPPTAEPVPAHPRPPEDVSGTHGCRHERRART